MSAIVKDSINLNRSISIFFDFCPKYCKFRMKTHSNLALSKTKNSPDVQERRPGARTLHMRRTINRNKIPIRCPFVSGILLPGSRCLRLLAA
jgi:hypothetical protein